MSKLIIPKPYSFILPDQDIIAYRAEVLNLAKHAFNACAARNIDKTYFYLLDFCFWFVFDEEDWQPPPYEFPFDEEIYTDTEELHSVIDDYIQIKILILRQAFDLYQENYHPFDSVEHAVQVVQNYFIGHRQAEHDNLMDEMELDEFEDDDEELSVVRH